MYARVDEYDDLESSPQASQEKTRRNLPNLAQALKSSLLRRCSVGGTIVYIQTLASTYSFGYRRPLKYQENYKVPAMRINHVDLDPMP